jgi:hypothetical protein
LGKILQARLSTARSFLEGEVATVMVSAYTSTTPRFVRSWILCCISLNLLHGNFVYGNSQHPFAVQRSRRTTHEGERYNDSLFSSFKEQHHPQQPKVYAKVTPTTTNHEVILRIRGGGPTNNNYRLSESQSNILFDTVAVVVQVVAAAGRTILPPTITITRAIVDFYRVLPMDAIVAQIGFVYAFAGGYYPTLFAAIQAAQHCGYQSMILALQILADEAVTAIHACDWSSMKSSERRKRDVLLEQTKVVLATIDPVRINDAVAALYTTWMSISIVLEREFARTIALSITIADSIRPLVSFVVNKPFQLCIPVEYQKWIPILIGWICKAVAMSLAWRIQRVLTAYTSAIAGGLMCSRALFRILRRRGIRLFGLIPKDLDKSFLDEFLGFVIASFGLYSQIGRGFSFEIPFPLNLVTWPFDLMERWIQWQITKKANQ